MARSAVHLAFQSNRGGSEFSRLYTSLEASVSGVVGVMSGTVPAEATSDVMMQVGRPAPAPVVTPTP